MNLHEFGQIMENGVDYTMLRNKLTRILEQAAFQAQKRGSLTFTTLPEVTVEHPQNPKHGDYASSLPLKLAKSTGLIPNIIAEKIIECMPELPEISKISVAHPGFINFTLNSDWLNKQVQEVLDAVDSYGSVDLGKSPRASAGRSHIGSPESCPRMHRQTLNASGKPAWWPFPKTIGGIERKRLSWEASAFSAP